MTIEKRTCPHCGRYYYHDRHIERCRNSPFAAADTCPMCGDPFDSFLDHLARCDGG
jgi:rRNA maturation protein Nop10